MAKAMAFARQAGQYERQAYRLNPPGRSGMSSALNP